MPAFRRITPLAVLVSVTVAFIILPIAMSAFLGDDLFNSTVNGLLREQDASIGAVAWSTTLAFFHSTARFLPGFYMQAYGLFHLAPGLATYKAVQITLLALDFVLLVIFLRAIRLDAGVIGAAVLLVLASIQFHGHYDGYLGFSGTNEFLLALAFGSWIMFAAYLRHENSWLLFGSIALFVMAAMSYELCYALSLIHGLIAYQARGRAGIRVALPFFVVTAIAFAQIALARSFNPQGGSKIYAFHLDPFDYVRTFFYQTTASLPLTYLAFHFSQLYPPGTRLFSASPPWLLIALALSAGAAAFLSLRGIATRPRALAVPAVIGLWLWVEAALLLAPIPRYQQEVQPGFGYSPMVIGGFGAGIFLACVLGVLVSRVPARVRTPVYALAAAFFALVLTASFDTNERTLTLYEGERGAVLNISAALDDGLASVLPNGSILLTDAPAELFHRDDAIRYDLRRLDNPRYFVREHADRSVRVRGLWETPPAVACSSASCTVSETYGLRDVPLDVRDGYSVIGEVRRVASSSGGTLRTWTSGLRIHLRGDRLARAAERSGLTLEYTCASDRSLRTTTLAASPDAIRRGTIAAVPATCLVDLETVQLTQSATGPRSS